MDLKKTHKKPEKESAWNVYETLEELVNTPCLDHLLPYKVKVGNLIRYTYAKSKRMALNYVINATVEITQCTIHEVVVAAKNVK